MSADDALITAMHTAGGSTSRPVSEWLTLAQEHAALRDAFRKIFGKRLPTPQKFGLYLSERMGKTAGPLRLEGRHSATRKAWVYRVEDYVRLAELARQEAERQVQIRAQFAAQAAAVQAHEPPRDVYMYEATRYDGTGKPLPRTMVMDPRTGEPVKKKSEVTEQPKPEPAETEKPRIRVQCGPKGNGALPPWFGRQPTRAELAAAHKQGGAQLEQNLVDLKRVTLKRDTTQPARDAYDRKWRAVCAMAERFATTFGEKVSIPAYLPPPQATAESTVTIEPGKAADGRYRETKGTKGMGASGKGGPLPGFPGTDANNAWLSVQGVKP